MDIYKTYRKKVEQSYILTLSFIKLQVFYLTKSDCGLQCKCSLTLSKPQSGEINIYKPI